MIGKKQKNELQYNVKVKSCTLSFALIVWFDCTSKIGWGEWRWWGAANSMELMTQTTNKKLKKQMHEIYDLLWDGLMKSTSILDDHYADG